MFHKDAARQINPNAICVATDDGMEIRDGRNGPMIAKAADRGLAWALAAIAR